MIRARGGKLGELFDIFRIDHKSDPNTRDTPGRIALMYAKELMSGRSNEAPPVTEAENAGDSPVLRSAGPRLPYTDLPGARQRPHPVSPAEEFSA